MTDYNGTRQVIDMVGMPSITVPIGNPDKYNELNVIQQKEGDEYKVKVRVANF